jgi:hypothetical protein
LWKLSSASAGIAGSPARSTIAISALRRFWLPRMSVRSLSMWRYLSRVVRETGVLGRFLMPPSNALKNLVTNNPR